MYLVCFFKYKSSKNKSYKCANRYTVSVFALMVVLNSDAQMRKTQGISEMWLCVRSVLKLGAELI